MLAEKLAVCGRVQALGRGGTRYMKDLCKDNPSFPKGFSGETFHRSRRAADIGWLLHAVNLAQTCSNLICQHVASE